MTEDEQKYEARIEGYVMRKLADTYDAILAKTARDAAEAMLSGSGSMYAAHLDIMREVADRMMAAAEASDRAFKAFFEEPS